MKRANDRTAAAMCQAQANGNELKIVFTDRIALQSLMECPVCLDICYPPIFQCNTGHPLCEKCQNSNGGKCGLCDEPFRGTRCLPLEYIFKKCSFSCCFSKDGCNQVLAGKHLKNHQQNCDYRPLCCPYECEDDAGSVIRIPFSKLLDHTSTTKCSQVVPCNDDGKFEYTFRLDKEELLPLNVIYTPREIQFDGRTFFAMNCSRNMTMASWVSILGNEEEANKFRVQIIIESMTNINSLKNSMSVRWEGPVVPIRLSEESIKNEGNCLFSSIHMLNEICKINSDSDPNVSSCNSGKIIDKTDGESLVIGEEEPQKKKRKNVNKPKRIGWFTIQCKLIKI